MGETIYDVMTTPVILLLAHGTPNALGEMAEYLGKVTGGRPLPHEVIEELQHRYAQIGLGETPGAEPPPLTRWTLCQGEMLEKATGSKVYVAMRNWHPYIADVIAQMRADGVTRFKAICLAPQNSRTSVGLYRKAVLDAAQDMEVEFIAGWAENPHLADAFAQRLWPVWTEACAVAGKRVPVLFTAHSVPCRTITSGSQDPDTYAVEVKRTAELVADRMAILGIRPIEWYFAFQSQGIAGGPWIGPTVEEMLKALKEQGETSVVLQPIGFLCDHVEILYDIDIAFTATAKELGMRLWRPESLNDSPELTSALRELATGICG